MDGSTGRTPSFYSVVGSTFEVEENRVSYVSPLRYVTSQFYFSGYIQSLAPCFKRSFVASFVLHSPATKDKYRSRSRFFVRLRFLFREAASNTYRFLPLNPSGQSFYSVQQLEVDGKQYQIHGQKLQYANNAYINSDEKLRVRFKAK